MSELFERWQRLVDRVRDGETIRAAELAAVAPLFTGAERANLVAELRSLASADERLPIGDVVLGPADDPAVSWPCPADQIALAIARTATAVALLGCAAEDTTGGNDAPWAAAGLTDELYQAAAATALSSAHGRAAPVQIDLAERWQLIACSGIPVVDAVSPYVRDASGAIDAFARRARRPARDDDPGKSLTRDDPGKSLTRDDERYALLDDLLACDPRLAGERAAAEATCGVLRLAHGVTVVQPRALDVGAADLRVRNALHALRRGGTQFVVTSCDGRAINQLLRAAAVPPERIAVVTTNRGNDPVATAERVEHVAGHRLCVDPAASDLLARCLPRELRLGRVARLVSLPAAAALRDEVAAALRQERGAVDEGTYPALLGATLGLEQRAATDRRGRWASPPPILCVSATPAAAGRVAAALWQACALETPTPAGGRRGRTMVR